MQVIRVLFQLLLTARKLDCSEHTLSWWIYMFVTDRGGYILLRQTLVHTYTFVTGCDGQILL